MLLEEPGPHLIILLATHRNALEAGVPCHVAGGSPRIITCGSRQNDVVCCLEWKDFGQLSLNSRLNVKLELIDELIEIFSLMMNTMHLEEWQR